MRLLTSGWNGLSTQSAGGRGEPITPDFRKTAPVATRSKPRGLPARTKLLALCGFLLLAGLLSWLRPWTAWQLLDGATSKGKHENHADRPGPPATELVGSAAGPIATLHGHEGEIYSVAFFKDSSRAVSSSADKSVRLWSIEESGVREIYRWKAKATRDQVATRSLVVSPDGRSLAAGEGDGRVRLWSLEDLGQPAGVELKHPSSRRKVQRVVFSADGAQIASADDSGTVCIWRSSTGQKRTEVTQGTSVLAVAFSPDGTSLLLGDRRGAVVLWDLEADRQQLSLEGHKHQVRSVGFTSDGLHALSAGGRLDNKGTADNTIRVWDLKTAKPGAPLPLERDPRQLHDVAFSPDGWHALSGHGDGSVRLWDLRTGEAVVTFAQAHQGAVTCVAFSGDGQLAISGGKDDLVKLWRLPTKQE